MCTASSHSGLVDFSAPIIEKKIGQMRVIIKKSITVRLVWPKKRIAVGKRAKVGKLWRTSKSGRAKSERVPR